MPKMTGTRFESLFEGCGISLRHRDIANTQELQGKRDDVDKKRGIVFYMKKGAAVAAPFT